MRKITVLFFGGLGNQLFQLALAKSLKKKYIDFDLELIDLTSYSKVKREWSLGFLGLKGKKINKFQYFLLRLKIFINKKSFKFGLKNNIFNIIDESHYSKFLLKKVSNKSFMMDGYWQSEKYFYDYKDEIKSFILRNQESMGNLKKKHENVALHIRLGDYKDFKTSKENHLVCDLSWYVKAVNFLFSKNDNLEFIIFTDDQNYIRSNFKLPNFIKYSITEQSSEPYIDMLKMSYCRHFIISNSSYSWWASYLGEDCNSFVVAPKYWYPKKLTSKLEICRSNWILL